VLIKKIKKERQRAGVDCIMEAVEEMRKIVKSE
jgi:hypothetical protein